MNSLRIPVGILVLILLALGAWYFISRPSSGSQPSQTQAATNSTSSRQAIPSPTPSAPTLNAAAVAQTIVGTWQSTDDLNYSVKITASGTWTDIYASSATTSASQTGTYELFTSQDPDKDFMGVLVPGVVYVKVLEGTSILYFSVLEASSDQLQLIYLDRNDTLSFVKVQ